MDPTEPLTLGRPVDLPKSPILEVTLQGAPQTLRSPKPRMPHGSPKAPICSPLSPALTLLTPALVSPVQGSQSPRRLQRGAQLRLHRQVPEHHGPAAQHLLHHPHHRPDRERHHHRRQPAPPPAAAGRPPLLRPHIAPSPAPGAELGPLQPPPPLGAGLRPPCSPSSTCWGLALLPLLLQVPLTTAQSAS